MTWVFQRAADSNPTYNIKEPSDTLQGGRALYDLKECLKSAGWTCIACGTGTGGGVFTDDVGPRITLAVLQGNAGGAWFAMQTPTGGKVLIFQKANYYNNVTDQCYWRIKVIPTGGINSDGTATQTPSAVTAARSAYLLGGGTDASPSFTLWSNAANLIFQVGADNANGYGFYVAGYVSGSLGFHPGVILMEPVTQSVGGDIDPCIYFVRGASSLQWAQAEFTASVKMWRKNGSGVWVFDSGNIGVPGCTNSNNSWNASWCNNMGVDNWGTNDQSIPVMYGQKWSYYGGGCFKGWGRSVLLTGSNRGTCTTRTINSAKDYWQIGDFLLPWGLVDDPATT